MGGKIYKVVWYDPYRSTGDGKTYCELIEKVVYGEIVNLVCLKSGFDCLRVIFCRDSENKIEFFDIPKSLIGNMTELSLSEEER